MVSRVRLPNLYCLYCERVRDCERTVRKFLQITDRYHIPVPVVSVLGTLMRD